MFCITTRRINGNSVAMRTTIRSGCVPISVLATSMSAPSSTTGITYFGINRMVMVTSRIARNAVAVRSKFLGSYR